MRLSLQTIPMAVTGASRPKVSVLMITHNHERYIEQAVRSVLAQRTDFDFELVVGEDHSTDRTREIVLAVASEYPNRIRVLLRDRNLGMIGNLIATHDACVGEYIAICEGDDWWTRADKLQTQVDHMDRHPACRLSFHDARIDCEPGIGDAGVIRPPERAQVGLAGWLWHRSWHGSYIPTASIVFRRPGGALPAWYAQLRFAGDWPLIAWLLSRGGELHYIEGEYAAYRRHPGGVTQATCSPDPKRRIAAIEADLADHLLVRNQLDAGTARLLLPRIAFLHFRLMTDHLALGDEGSARRHLHRAATTSGTFAWRMRRPLLRNALRLHCPQLFDLASRARRALR